jgi:hypothetical protein
MFLTIDVIKIDVLVVDVLELDVLGARQFFLVIGQYIW